MSREEKYDLILVGTGFANAFFLRRYLQTSAEKARVLVLERGPMRSHENQIEQRKEKVSDFSATCENVNPKKPWNFVLGFGGGSNGWWACTPRMLPEDFELQSRYGVATDWPVSYNDLEEHYCESEEIMQVSGPDNSVLFPRSRPYPQQPHLFNDVDRLIKKAYPDLFFAQPAARPTTDTDMRPACCAAGVCGLCPIDSKFTVLNEMLPLFEDERVTLRLGASVQTVETQNKAATGVTYLKEGRTETARGELVVLGANAIFNPHILLRSGIEHPLLGRRLNEQVSVDVWLELNGVDNFQGSTSITGHGYMLYGGAHRAEHAAALMETWNVPQLRDQRGRWRQIAHLKFVFEDLPSEKNYVAVSRSDSARPRVVHEKFSSYAMRGLKSLETQLPRIAKSLPVENVRTRMNRTDSHIQGTVLMGDDPKTSIVDRHLIHHEIRNLVVLGSSAFPTCPPANPTLTICALSLFSAEHLFA